MYRGHGPAVVDVEQCSALMSFTSFTLLCGPGEPIRIATVNIFSMVYKEPGYEARWDCYWQPQFLNVPPQDSQVTVI